MTIKPVRVRVYQASRIKTTKGNLAEKKRIVIGKKREYILQENTTILSYVMKREETGILLVI